MKNKSDKLGGENEALVDTQNNNPITTSQSFNFQKDNVIETLIKKLNDKGI